MEIAQSLQCSPGKPVGLSSIHRTHVKDPGVVTHICPSGKGRWEQGDLRGSLANQVQVVRDLVSKNKGGQYLRLYPNIYPHVHTCEHTHKERRKREMKERKKEGRRAGKIAQWLGPRFNSRHSHGNPQPSTPPVPGDLMPSFFWILRYQICM